MRTKTEVYRTKTEVYKATGGAKSPDEYRQLAQRCREVAGTKSAANERAELLARAQAWDVIAERVRAQREGHRP